MARNIDEFVTPTEHATIDHTGIPGVGGGAATIVGAQVLFAADDPGATGTLFSLPANTMTADGQSLDIELLIGTGDGSPTSWTFDLGPSTLITWASLPTAPSQDNIANVKLMIIRTSATTATVTYEAKLTRDDVSIGSGFDTVISGSQDGVATVWANALDIASGFSGGTNEFIRNMRVLKWPASGALGVTGIGSDTLPVGVIVPFGATVASIPSGFLPCDGTAVSRVAEAELFAIIGETWGIGDGATTFNLPDLRHKSIIGLNDGTLPAGADGGFTTRNLADTGGAETVSHSHASGTYSGAASGSTQTVDNNLDGSTVPVSDPSHTHAITGTSGSDNSTNLPPFAICPYIIKSRQLGGGVGVTAQANGGSLEGVQPTLNFIPSGGAGVSVVEDVGNSRLDITISAPAATTDTAYATGRTQTGSIPSGAGGPYSVSSSWTGAAFTPHGMILLTGSTTDGFAAIGFVAATTSGVVTEAHLSWTGVPTIGTGSSLATFGGSAILSATPASNNWDVTRSGTTGNAWSYASMVLGRVDV